jgi:hypothetical protein
MHIGTAQINRVYELFEIPVAYKNKELLFPARLLQLGFTHRFAVDVDGQEIFFEPDEERSYRAMINPGYIEKNTKLDVELLRAIAVSIEEIRK